MPKKLNKSQQDAVNIIDGPLLIIAGAGTGKTTVITEKISHLVKSGKAKPEEILALTFTDKAAEEMKERVDDMLNIGYVDLQISTFHTFCQRLLEQFGIDIGISNHFKLLTETDAWLLLRQHMLDLDLDYYRPAGNPARHIHELLKHFSKCKDELISPAQYLEYAENIKLDKDDVHGEEKSRLTEIANAYHAYNQLLLDNNALDFGDLMYYTVSLLEKRKKIKENLQQRFKYILIDEFQDVNWAQYVLITLLAEHAQLTVVGDDDQSIYAFRGSNVSIIMRFKEDFPKAQEIVLSENFRSTQNILDLAYKSIQENNPDRLEAKFSINKKLTAFNGKSKEKNSIVHLHYATLDEEVSGVVSQINSLKKNNPDVTWDDIAILARANTHVEPFIQALEQSGIPYEYLASSGLYRQKIVLDCFNYFRVLDNNKESSAIYRLLRLPFLNMSDFDLQQFTSFCKRKSISYVQGLRKGAEIGLSQEGIAACQKITSWISEGMRRERYEKPSVVLYTFLEESGYLSYLTHEENQGNTDAMREILFLKQFFDFISAYEKAVPDAHVRSFVEHYTAILDSGDAGGLHQPTETRDSVNIMTVHGSKGLEFKYVFLINMVEERFPTRRKGKGIEVPIELIHEQPPEGDIHYQEERRLFYVGLTRAKEQLFLTSADNYGGVRKKKLSRFLAEIGYDTNCVKEAEKSLLTSKKETKSDRGAVEYDIPKKFSFSQLKMYEICPYKYKLAHILKLPMKGSPHFSFGNTIHNTLQKFYEKVKELNGLKQDSLFGLPSESSVQSNIQVPSLDDLLNMYEESWIEDWYESKWQKETYHKKGRDILKIFYAAQEDHWTIPISLEGFFKIKLGDDILHGRIDRIDKQEDGTLEIIDYKTGKGKEKLASGDKDQLLVYQIAAETLPEYSNVGSPGKLTFYYVEDNIQTSFIGKNEELEKLKDKLIQKIEKIKQGDFKATPNKIMCRRCDFRDICEFRAK